MKTPADTKPITRLGRTYDLMARTSIRLGGAPPPATPLPEHYGPGGTADGEPGEGWGGAEDDPVDDAE